RFGRSHFHRVLVCFEKKKVGVMQESYQWIAEYDDGTLLAEEPGVGFKDIDQKRLKYFVLQPLDEKLPTVALYVSEGMRLIFFRRRAVIPDMEMQELEQTHKER